MEELKKIFLDSEIEVRLDNERYTQYGITVPNGAAVSVKDIVKIDEFASMTAMSDGLYISVLIFKH